MLRGLVEEHDVSVWQLKSILSFLIDFLNATIVTLSLVLWPSIHWHEPDSPDILSS
jgi:hypothetical protein